MRSKKEVEEEGSIDKNVVVKTKDGLLFSLGPPSPSHQSLPLKSQEEITGGKSRAEERGAVIRQKSRAKGEDFGA